MVAIDDASTSGASRQEIVEAAFERLSAAGPHDDLYPEVARASGVGQQDVEAAFPTEVELLIATLDYWDSLAGDVMAGPEDPGVDQLRGVVRLLERNATAPGLAALHCRLSADAASSPDHPAHVYYADRYRAVIDGTVDVLQQMAARGELAEGVEPRAAANVLIAVLDGLQLQWLIDPSMVDVPAVLRRYLETLLPAGTPL